MFYIFFPGFIETYVTQPGLFQMMSKTQQSMKHAIEVLVDIQQSHQSTEVRFASFLSGGFTTTGIPRFPWFRFP